LKFQEEIWAGRACAGTNQQELHKKWRVGRRKKIQEKWEQLDKHRCQPAVAHQPRVDIYACQVVPILFIILKIIIFGSLEIG
jgi:hypothetical protein